jgi:hypothetical protein
VAPVGFIDPARRGGPRGAGVVLGTFDFRAGQGRGLLAGTTISPAGITSKNTTLPGYEYSDSELAIGIGPPACRSRIATAGSVE